MNIDFGKKESGSFFGRCKGMKVPLVKKYYFYAFILSGWVDQ